MTIVRLLVSLFVVASLITATAAQSVLDRTTCFLPANARGSDVHSIESSQIQTPADAFPDASPDWQHYLQAWKDYRDDPKSDSLRRYLGQNNPDRMQVRRGSGAPTWLAWKPASYQHIETNHFSIYCRTDRRTSAEVARALEQCYWVWTQMFFPLWEGPSQQKSNRQKLQVVVFRDAQQYIQTLGRDNPGIEQSTGFYSDQRQTTFLIGKPLDLPTVRHELVHQLFREATGSKLVGNRSDDEMPGSERDFWLVEGIAGYFESMSVGAGGTATIGGWDSPRMQFARYRVLSGGDTMPLEELRRDGRLSAQSRTDLPRWYAHAIARTHQMMDGGDAQSRHWIYQKLAELYEIDADLGPPSTAMPADESLADFLRVNDELLQTNPPTRSLTQLCLAHCDVTARGIASLPVSADLRWLDLSGLPVKTADVIRLLPIPTSLEQLSLEATPVDDDLASWLVDALALRELDLSWTSTGDLVTQSLGRAKRLSTLWMTGSQVSDASVDPILKMNNLSSVDVQRTAVSEAGCSRLQQERPKLSVNPLQLRSQ